VASADTGRYTAAGQPREVASAPLLAAAASPPCDPAPLVAAVAGCPVSAAGAAPPAARNAAPAPPSHSAAANTAGVAPSSKQCQPCTSRPATPQSLLLVLLLLPAPSAIPVPLGTALSSCCQAANVMVWGGPGEMALSVWVCPEAGGVEVRASPMTNHSRVLTPVASWWGQGGRGGGGESKMA
jgi:hypothetical protein